MVIRGDQWPSVAIGGYQWLPVGISGHQWSSAATDDRYVIGGHPQSSAAIISHQRSSAVIGGHQRSSAAISGHRRPSAVIGGHQRSSAAITCEAFARKHTPRMVLFPILASLTRPQSAAQLRPSDAASAETVEGGAVAALLGFVSCVRCVVTAIAAGEGAGAGCVPSHMETRTVLSAASIGSPRTVRGESRLPAHLSNRVADQPQPATKLCTDEACVSLCATVP